jgi:hypothetical protein
MRRHLPRLLHGTGITAYLENGGTLHTSVVMLAAFARRRTIFQALNPIEPLAVKLRLAAAVRSILDGLEQWHASSLG